MNARKKLIEGEQVLVRHIDAPHNDLSHIERFLKAPFDSDCRSSCYGGSKDVSISGYATGRYMIAARFARQSWVALYSNTASGEELFKVNASSRKLEVAWVGCRPGVGWFFRLNRAGKRVVEFAQALDDESPSTCKLVGVEPNVLKAGESGEQAVDRLCKLFQISRPMPQIRASEDGFQVIGVSGRPMKSGLRGYLRWDGPTITEGENEASDALAEAIDRCDANGIRKAIAQGASLTVLPDTSVSPLLSALYKFGKPGWKECVEVLLELGSPINGSQNDPPIVDCVADYIDVENAMKTVELLLAHGADVNATTREGVTALFRCVIDRRVELVRFLMQHGADATIKDRNGISPLEWVRTQYEEEVRFSRRVEYAELLSLLTGQPIPKPEASALSPALQAENERFQLCLKALRLLDIMPKAIDLEQVDVRLLPAPGPWYWDWQQELFDAGFQFAGHYSYLQGITWLSAYTNPEPGFDALLSLARDLGDQPRCEVAAYHDDNTITQVTNLQAAVDPDLAAPSLIGTEFKGASPRQLIAHLQDLVQGKRVLPLDADSFASRYKEALNRIASEMRERATHVLKTPSILIDGSPPRYERLGFYFDFTDWDDPSYSTEKWAQNWLKDFDNATREPPETRDDGIYAAMALAAMSHFQFAGAPDPFDFVVGGCDLALAYYQAHAHHARRRGEPVPWWEIRALLHSLLLCALAKRWQTFKQICNAIHPKMASVDTTEADIDYAKVLLLFVSSYRDQPLPMVTSLEQAVQKGRARRPRYLLQVCRAIGTGRQADFEEALRRSLESFLEKRGDGFVLTRRRGRVWSNDIFRFVALPESLFHLAALERGLRVPPLPEHLADLLITPESLRVAR